MKKVLVMYKLKKGVSLEDYWKWSTELDQKITPFQPGVYRYEIFAIEGCKQGESPYHIVEEIEIDSFEQWQEVVNSEPMKEVVKTWANYADESSLTTIYGKKIK